MRKDEATEPTHAAADLSAGNAQARVPGVGGERRDLPPVAEPVEGCRPRRLSERGRKNKRRKKKRLAEAERVKAVFKEALQKNW